MVHSVEALLHAHLVADRTTGTIQPDLVFRHHSDRLDDERAVVHPFADRVAIKARLSNFLPHEHSSIHQFRNLSPIRPDPPPALPIFIQDGHFVLVLQDLSLSKIIEIGSWKSQWFARIPRIII